MRAFYCDEFVLPLPPEHRFPMTKYGLLRQRLLATGVLAAEDLEVPAAIAVTELLRVHTEDYVQRVVEGALTPQEVRRLGFPWSPALVERSRRSVGGTLAACRSALSRQAAVNLAGGTHHAFADHGEGYCVFNDAAVAIRALQAEGRVRRVLIVDCDVHQGNGTAAIFRDDPTVFTFSLHGRRNYPFRKEASDLDLELEDGAGDEAYLDLLEEGLGRVFPTFAADLVLYVAGADPYVGDRLGRLALTRDGLRARDGMVFDTCRRYGRPVAVVMAGGYADNVDEIVEIHRTTVELAKDLERRWAGEGSLPVRSPLDAEERSLQGRL
jgi:acetoin utilization deacetylase AcuC-like enzyme